MYQQQNTRKECTLRVSQNFLTSAWTIERLLYLTSLSVDDHVLEIGPGKGHITRALSARCGRVTAVELDPKLYAGLRAKLAGTANVELLHGDFLTYRLPATGEYKIFSNIPFNRTTDIVRKLAQAPNLPAEAWLVMEKGAAKRFCGRPRESLRSLLLKPCFSMEIVYHFRREDFHPMPSVDAVLLHLKRKERPDVVPEQRQSFERFVASGMNGGLNGLARFLPRRRLQEACREAGVPLYANPGDILYIQWLCLYRCIAPERWIPGHKRAFHDKQ